MEKGEEKTVPGNGLDSAVHDLTTCASQLLSFQLPEGDPWLEERRRRTEAEGFIFYALEGPFIRSTTGAPSVSNGIRKAGYTIDILTCPRN